MKIVIDIEDYDREWIANGYHIPDEINRKIAEAIIDGTPLPKHHGRLIDADELLENAYQVYDKVRHMWSPDFVVNTEYIYSAPTILEAEGSESE